MKKNIIFIVLDVIALIVFVIIWFLLCFLSGYLSSNANHNLDIWILYSITVILHFSLMYFVYKNWFIKLNFLWYSIISIIVYLIIAFVLNNY